MKWGLIGASRIAADTMISAIQAQKNHHVKGVLSSSSVRGKAYAEQNGIPYCTTDLGRLLADPEISAVYISTTNEKHKAQALAAIAAGKHVLCEKPLAMTVSDAVQMNTAAQVAGLVFATNHHLRNAGSHLQIKALIDDGRIGEIISVRIFHAVYLPESLQSWRINNASAGGGVIPDIVVHDADTIRFHLQEDPHQVVAMMRSTSMGLGVEDSVMSLWAMPSGVMVQTHESFTHRYAQTGIEFYGNKGSIIARDVMAPKPIGTVKCVDEQGAEDIDFSNHNPYERSVALFIAAIKGTSQPAATGIDGIKSLAVALAVKESATTGQAVHVNYGRITL